MIRTGIVGNETVCQDYIEKINSISELRLVGFFDPDNQSKNNRFGLKNYQETQSLLHEVDAVIALAPMSSPSHIENFVKNSKHVLFEPTQIYSRHEVAQLIR
jgi:predicted dehydrogenase